MNSINIPVVFMAENHNARDVDENNNSDIINTSANNPPKRIHQKLSGAIIVAK